MMKTRNLLLLLLAIFLDSDDGNKGKDLEWQLYISLAKGYGQKYGQHLKTIIYAAVLGREAVFFFYMALVSKER